METLSLDLPEDLQAFVDRQAREKGYATGGSDVVELIQLEADLIGRRDSESPKPPRD